MVFPPERLFYFRTRQNTVKEGTTGPYVSWGRVRVQLPSYLCKNLAREKAFAFSLSQLDRHQLNGSGSAPLLLADRSFARGRNIFRASVLQYFLGALDFVRSVAVHGKQNAAPL